MIIELADEKKWDNYRSSFSAELEKLEESR
jgi:hypothetical protein